MFALVLCGLFLLVLGLFFFPLVLGWRQDSRLETVQASIYCSTFLYDGGREITTVNFPVYAKQERKLRLVMRCIFKYLLPKQDKKGKTLPIKNSNT